MQHYTLIIERADDGHLWGYFPDVPGCTTAAATVEQVRSNAAEALALHLDGEDVPAARPLKAILAEGLELAETDIIAQVTYEQHANAAH